MKKSEKESIYEEARELRYNKGLSIKELALHYGKSERTIYRWLKSINCNKFNGEKGKKIKHKRVRR
ncbi:MAG: helix-turn-helix domain-containing protein [Promethearchaeota archaeon]